MDGTIDRSSLVKDLSKSIAVGTRKMVIYAWTGWSQGKLWWRLVAILTCKSFVWFGYRGERLIEPSFYQRCCLLGRLDFVGFNGVSLKVELKLWFCGVKRFCVESTQTSTKMEGKHQLSVSGIGAASSSGDSQFARFLLELSDSDAQALYQVMRANIEVSQFYPVSVQQMQALANLQSKGSTRDGQWYCKLVTCLTARPKKSKSDNVATGNSHGRFQFRLEGGAKSVFGQLQQSMSKNAIQRLKALNISQQAKIGYHLIAYNSKPSRALEPIPLNIGSGGSIDHLCDRQSCIQLDHLRVSAVHGDNLDRQRCTGICLLVFRNIIVKEIPCKHGMKAVNNAQASLESFIRHSCLRIQIVEISDNEFELMKTIGAGAKWMRGQTVWNRSFAAQHFSWFISFS